ncbi:MAG: tetratricopeptide repeat protein [Planctomycetota bacterium]|jgi:arylsulfatase A-like enzyme/Flp pilus assembly protein TadD
MKNETPSRYYLSLSGILLAAVIGTVCYLQFLSSAPKEFRNVLLISIDTCRADHLSCYGYPQKNTPNIDAIAAEGVLFENAISPAPITLPAHSSMLTGTVPPYHGVHNNGDYQLKQSNITLAQILKQNGFTTGGIVSALVLDSKYGIDRGFDTYNDEFENERDTTCRIVERTGDETSRCAVNWLQQNKDEKFFLFLHYFDPHADYLPPEPFASKYSHDPYAGEIAFVDHCIGEVLSKLKELGLYDSTLIIITADHGEMRFEHGEPTHSYFIYQNALKVPLIFRLPGSEKQRRIKHVAGLVDVAPTICSLAGIEMPSEVQGIDLSAYIKGRKAKARDRYIFCESMTPTIYNANSLLGVVTDRWKYIQTTRPELYDLVNDPRETGNLINQQPHQGRILRDRLKQILEQSIRKDEADSKIELDAAGRKQLQSLGYIAGDIIEDFSFDQTKDDPKDLIAFYNADLNVSDLLFKKRYEQAEVLAEKLIRQRPDCYIGYEHMVEIIRHRENHSEIISHLKKILELKPENVEANSNLGAAFQQQNRLDEAITQYRIALQIDPYHVTAHDNLGNVLTAKGRFAEAIGHFQQSLQIKPRSFHAHWQLGNNFQSLGKLDEAISHFTRAIEFNPNYAPAHYNLAETYFQQDRITKAIAHYTEALRIRPEYVRAHLHLGLALARQGNTDQAINHYKKAIQLEPESIRAHLNLARTLQLQHRFDEAIGHLKKATRLDPNSAPTHYNLARILNETGRTEEAVTHLTEALRIKPDWLKPINSLAWLLATHNEAKFRNPAEAIRLAEHACSLTDHKDAGLVDTLAAAYAAAGRFSEAVTAAQKAVELAKTGSNKERTEKIRNRLELYKAGLPYFNPPLVQEKNSP